MSGSVFLLPAARLEVIEGHRWYDSRSPGLGEEFNAELDHQVARITANPSHFPVVHADIRRVRLRRFPYALYFRALPDGIYVIACFHSSRDPKVWQDRIS